MGIFGKKQQPETEEVTLEEDAIVLEDGELEEEAHLPIINEIELGKLDVFEARAAMQIAIKEKFAFQEQLLLIKQRTELDAVRRKQYEAIKSLEIIKQEHNDFRRSIEERLGVNLNDYTVRDDGVMLPIEGGNEEA